MGGGGLYLAEGEACWCGKAGAVVDNPMEAWGGEAIAAKGASGGRRVGSLSRADLDRLFSERRSAMDYAIGGQAGGGGSDGRSAGCNKRFIHGPSDAEDTERRARVL